MEILYLQEHLNCIDYELDPDKAQIEVLEFEKGQKLEKYNNSCAIIFFLRGEVSLTIDNFFDYEGTEREFIFLSGGKKKLLLQALTKSSVIIFRLNKMFKLCQCFPVGKLYTKIEEYIVQYKSNPSSVKPLRMIEYIYTLLTGIEDCVKSRLCCKYFFELKISEFFFILRICYSKEQLTDFFAPILSADIYFLERVHRNWDKCLTARQLADSLNMTPKSFLSRFKLVFGTTPYRWMKQSKARMIHSDLINRSKPLKQIAVDNGFAELSQFSAFCKKELGSPPSKIRENGTRGN